ncbi:hypothetical protein [Bradyrhizobium sp. ORS 285]|uniref:hypothetical protein n=1 Tax=Bradyrhizobium sp. ORS 285 TaxID=115808 RepID=UPI0011120210|nr:hypothetical protein [Bradyrhizobium sp. ORS 285]
MSKLIVLSRGPHGLAGEESGFAAGLFPASHIRLGIDAFVIARPGGKARIVQAGCHPFWSLHGIKNLMAWLIPGSDVDA